MTHEEMESLTAATKPVSAPPPTRGLVGSTNSLCGWGQGVSLWLSVPSVLLCLPRNPPLLSPLPTNGSGDQGDQLGAGRGVGWAWVHEKAVHAAWMPLLL